MDEADRIAYVRSEYARWLNIVGTEDPYVGRVTIGIHEVLQAHFLLAEYFARIGEGIGGLGPKDIRLLHSALTRQFVQFGGKVKWGNRLDVCATLILGSSRTTHFTMQTKELLSSSLFCIFRKSGVRRQFHIKGTRISPLR